MSKMQKLNRGRNDLIKLQKQCQDTKKEKIMLNRVSQKIQKSEFWNATYPSGFHGLDEPPERISAL